MANVYHLTTVHNRYDPRILLKECVSLVNNGNKVCLLVSDDLPNENFKGVQVESLGKYKNRLNIKLFINILSKIRKSKPSIIHFHDPELIVVCLLIKLLFRIRVIYDIHEDYVTAADHKKHSKGFRLILKNIFLVMEFIARKSFTTIIAEKYYSYRFPKAIKILNYPIVTDFKNQKKRNYRVSKLIYTGNITSTRGAFIHSNIVNISEKYDVYFVGKCNESIFNSIREKVGKNINRIHFEEIDTYVPYNLILKRYSEDWLAGLAIFPDTDHYRKKELTKFFEYMYEGLPVICSNFSVWRKLIEQNNCGICVDPNNVTEILGAIDYLYYNEEKAKEFGSNGRRSVQEKYNWSNEEKKLIKAYSKI